MPHCIEEERKSSNFLPHLGYGWTVKIKRFDLGESWSRLPKFARRRCCKLFGGLHTWIITIRRAPSSVQMRGEVFFRCISIVDPVMTVIVLLLWLRPKDYPWSRFERNFRKWDEDERASYWSNRLTRYGAIVRLRMRNQPQYRLISMPNSHTHGWWRLSVLKIRTLETSIKNRDFFDNCIKTDTKCLERDPLPTLPAFNIWTFLQLRLRGSSSARACSGWTTLYDRRRGVRQKWARTSFIKRHIKRFSRGPAVLQQSS